MSRVFYFMLLNKFIYNLILNRYHLLAKALAFAEDFKAALIAEKSAYNIFHAMVSNVIFVKTDHSHKN